MGRGTWLGLNHFPGNELTGLQTKLFPLSVSKVIFSVCFASSNQPEDRTSFGYPFFTLSYPPPSFFTPFLPLFYYFVYPLFTLSYPPFLLFLTLYVTLFYPFLPFLTLSYPFLPFLPVVAHVFSIFPLVYPFFIPFYPVLLCFSLFVSPPPTNLKIGNRWGLNFGIAASSWVENSQILWWWRNLFCKTLSWKLFICYARVHIMCSTLYNEGQISSVKEDVNFRI